MDCPRSSYSDESIFKGKAKVNLKRKEVLFNDQDYKVLDGCL